MKTIDLINSNEEVANKKSVKFSSKNNQDSKFKEKDKEKEKEKENKEKESTLNMRHLSKIITSNYDPTDDSNWERFLKEFKSLHRNFESWEVIHGYFLTLTRFVEYLKNTYGSGYIEYLSALTLYSNYFFCKSNSLLMKKGDRGERFYFILKGKLQILVLTPARVKVTEEDYYKYLFNLKINMEDEIYNKVLIKNSSIFPLKAEQLEFLSNSISRDYVRRTKRRTNASSDFLQNHPYAKVSSTDIFNIMKYEKVGDRFKNLTEYINLSKPNEDKDNPNAKEIDIEIYDPKATLCEGFYFGERALQNPDDRRSATIYALEDTHLAYITRETYNKYFKSEFEKSIKYLTSCIHNTMLFKSLPRKLVEKKYYSMFVQQKIEHGYELLKQGQDFNSIYISIEGSYEISIKDKFANILSMIEYYGGKKECKLLTYVKKNFHFKFEEFLKQETNLKVFLVNGKEIFGLSSMFNVYTKKCLYNVQLVTSKGLVFFMDENGVNSLRLNYNIRQGEKQKVTEQVNLFLQRLNELKEVSLESFLRRYGDDKIANSLRQTKYSGLKNISYYYKPAETEVNFIEENNFETENITKNISNSSNNHRYSKYGNSDDYNKEDNNYFSKSINSKVHFDNNKKLVRKSFNINNINKNNLTVNKILKKSHTYNHFNFEERITSFKTEFSNILNNNGIASNKAIHKHSIKLPSFNSSSSSNIISGTTSSYTVKRTFSISKINTTNHNLSKKFENSIKKNFDIYKSKIEANFGWMKNKYLNYKGFIRFFYKEKIDKLYRKKSYDFNQLRSFELIKENNLKISSFVTDSIPEYLLYSNLYLNNTSNCLFESNLGLLHYYFYITLNKDFYSDPFLLKPKAKKRKFSKKKKSLSIGEPKIIKEYSDINKRNSNNSILQSIREDKNDPESNEDDTTRKSIFSCYNKNNLYQIKEDKEDISKCYNKNEDIKLKKINEIEEYNLENLKSDNKLIHDHPVFTNFTNKSLRKIINNQNNFNKSIISNKVNYDSKNKQLRNLSNDLDEKQTLTSLDIVLKKIKKQDLISTYSENERITLYEQVVKKIQKKDGIETNNQTNFTTNSYYPSEISNNRQLAEDLSVYSFFGKKNKEMLLNSYSSFHNKSENYNTNQLAHLIPNNKSDNKKPQYNSVNKESKTLNSNSSNIFVNNSNELNKKLENQKIFKPKLINVLALDNLLLSQKLENLISKSDKANNMNNSSTINNKFIQTDSSAIKSFNEMKKNTSQIKNFLNLNMEKLLDQKLNEQIKFKNKTKYQNMVLLTSNSNNGNQRVSSLVQSKAKFIYDKLDFKRVKYSDFKPDNLKISINKIGSSLLNSKRDEKSTISQDINFGYENYDDQADLQINSKISILDS